MHRLSQTESDNTIFMNCLSKVPLMIKKDVFSNELSFTRFNNKKEEFLL